MLTQPDRPSGRGLAMQASAVKALAQERGIEVMQPPTLRSEEARTALSAIALDVLVVAAYGLILPPAVLSWPRLGCLNIHASLLPRWRGAAPIQHAILAGDAATGVTIMQMDAGLDTGPDDRDGPNADPPDRYRRRAHRPACRIGRRRHRSDARRGCEAAGPLASTPQPAEGATYAAQDRQRAGVARLDVARGSARAQGARVRSRAGRPLHARGRRRQSLGGRNRTGAGHARHRAGRRARRDRDRLRRRQRAPADRPARRRQAHDRGGICRGGACRRQPGDRI